MIIKVESCSNCPFCGEDYQQKVCNLIPDYGDWKEDAGFDEMYERDELPLLSCPLLKHEEITVTINEI